MSEQSPHAGPPTPGSPPHRENPQIAAAIAQLDRLGEVPVDEHPAIFDAVHSRLRDALTHAGRVDDAAHQS